MSSSASEPAPMAYSYIRFSTPEQASGDSLRRQTEAVKKWCKKNDVTLDTSVTLHDLGKSAYLGEHRKNPDRFALAAFLKLVEDDKVPRGSYLIVEALDRLTREHTRAALMLCLGLIEHGIRIVQLSPSEMVYDEKSDDMGLMIMIVELSRGHRESKRKSEMVGSAWEEKKRRARAGEAQKSTKRMGDKCQAMTHMLPGWIEERAGKLRVIPKRGAVVKRIYGMAAAGQGVTSILRKLTDDKVPAFGDGVIKGEKSKRAASTTRWSRPYIYAILKDRRAAGEFQPRLRNGTPDGDPIPGYYPAAVTEGEWEAARVAVAGRRTGGPAGRRAGRNSPHGVNMFQGLLYNARDGDVYYCTTKKETGRPIWRRALVTAKSTSGGGPAWSFPYPAFEQAIVSLLREIDHRHILPGNRKSEELAVKSGELKRVESRLAEVGDALLDGSGNVKVLAQAAQKLEDRKKELAAQVSVLRREVAHPQSESWGAAQSLMAALDSAPDPEAARLRLRAEVRRVITEIWVLVVPRGRDRLAAVQVYFDGDGHRDYLIFARSARAGYGKRREPYTWAKSLPPELARSVLDLRIPKQAELLAARLEVIDLEALSGS